MENQNFITAMKDEYTEARLAFKPFSSAHEGYAVLLEELDELWECVKKNKGYRIENELGEKARKECIQVAAMAMAFAMECCNE